jgi:uncharacterized repeat protein (TIGR01451 family)
MREQNTASFIVARYSSGWTYPAVGTKTPTSTQATGLTAFSDFQVGDGGPPIVGLVKSVSPSGIQQPGTDLAYTAVFTNSGSSAAATVAITDAIPANTDFKVGSETHNLRYHRPHSRSDLLKQWRHDLRIHTGQRWWWRTSRL